MTDGPDRGHAVNETRRSAAGGLDNNAALIRSWRSELLASVSAPSVAKAYRLGQSR